MFFKSFKILVIRYNRFYSLKRLIGIRDQYRKYRTRNYARDLDQIQEDIKKVKEHGDDTILKVKEWNEDLPGLGEFYCVSCA